MNSTISFNDQATYLSALNVLEMTSTPEYVTDEDTLTITTEDAHGIIDILMEDGIDDFSAQFGAEDEPFDGFRNDAEADADALRSAGFDDEEFYCPSIDSFGED